MLKKEPDSKWQVPDKAAHWLQDSWTVSLKNGAQFMGEKDDDGVANLEAGDEDHCKEVAREDVLCVLHARQNLSPSWFRNYEKFNKSEKETFLG